MTRRGGRAGGRMGATPFVHVVTAIGRPFNFVPQKFGALRDVPGYENLVQERFERCLDLYLCPRAKKKRVRFAVRSRLPAPT